MDKIQLIYEEAINNKPELLQYIDDQTENLCIKAIKKDPKCIKYVKNITNNIKKTVILNDPYYVFELELPTQDDLILAIESSNNESICNMFTKEMITPLIKKILLKKYPLYIKLIPIEEQKEDEVNIAVNNYCCNIQDEIKKETIYNNIANIISFYKFSDKIKDMLKNINHYLINSDNLQKIILFVKYEPKILLNINSDILTKEIYNTAIKINSKCFQYIPVKFITEEMCNIIVNLDPFMIKYIPKEYATEELGLIAMSKNVDAYSLILYKTTKHTLELLKHNKVPNDEFTEYSIKILENISKLSLGLVYAKYENKPIISQDIIFKFKNSINIPIEASCLYKNYNNTSVISNNVLYITPNGFCFKNILLTDKQLIYLTIKRKKQIKSDIIKKAKIYLIELYIVKNIPNINYIGDKSFLAKIKLCEIFNIECLNYDYYLNYYKHKIKNIIKFDKLNKNNIYYIKKILKKIKYFPGKLEKLIEPFNKDIEDELYLIWLENFPFFEWKGKIKKYFINISKKLLECKISENKAPLNIIEPDDKFIKKILKKYPEQVIYITNPTYKQIKKGIKANKKVFWDIKIYIDTTIKDKNQYKKLYMLANDNLYSDIIPFSISEIDEDIVKKTIKLNGKIIESLPSIYQNNIELINLALDTYPLAIKNIPKNNQTFEQCKKVLEQDISLYTYCNFIPNELYNVYVAWDIKKKYNNFRPNNFNINNEINTFSDEIKGNITISQINIEFAKLGAIGFIDRKFYYDINFTREVLKYDGSAIFYIDKPTEKDYLNALQSDGLLLWAIDLQTEEMCLTAIKQNILAFLLVDNQTEEICKYVYKINPELMIFFENKFDYLTDLDFVN